MNETAAPSCNPLPSPRRRRWMGLLLLGAAFLSGMICGGGLAVVAVHRAARQAVRHPELRSRQAARWMARRLSLDGAQQERVRAILERQAAELKKLRLEVWPRVLERLETTEREIEGELSAPQRQKWRKTAERLRGNWLPPDDDKQK
ncbi:MAG: hypothetical protein HY922_13900 [Elusimicrobia bacterium]|nr:hypothetical protein [Elusimicrobiota bacterium]